MPLFPVSIFLSAFLLFQVQPLIGKWILPWFGGTPAVWSTSLLFFQALLTGGYAYASWLVTHVRPGRQGLVHVGLLLTSLLLLFVLAFLWDSPVTPGASWQPGPESSPVLEIFRLLFAAVGLPFFLLAANGPLMQAWFSRLHPDRPYARLYALSNTGSLLGLLTYPVLIEPLLSTVSQGWLWAGGFLLFGLLVSGIVVRLSRVEGGAVAQPGAPEPGSATPPSLALRSLWIALSGTASLFLLSATNQITQEVAVIPFLWVLPLALYLLSFILAFAGERGYHRRFYAGLFLLFALLTLFVMLNTTRLHVYWQILAYSGLLFSACMLCHGELYRLRPEASHLTGFYLSVSVGGAAGGIFVSLIAPVFFNGYWEFFVGLAMTFALLLTFRRPGNTHGARARFVLTVFVMVTAMLAVLSAFFSGALFTTRNFYGVIRVRELVPEGSDEPAYVMSHGITVHGLQFIRPGLRATPTTYYVPGAGAGLAIRHHPAYERPAPMRVGLLGLGVGTLAAYGRPGDEYRLYEINPEVIDLALGRGGFFSFLRDSPAQLSIVPGDARISLERELASGQSHGFDVLVLDTFSSDSIPVHLVTAEAFHVYLRHLAPDGIIAAHITNQHLDLQPVFRELAAYHDMSIVRLNYEGDARGGFASHWILLARDPALLDAAEIQAHAVHLSDDATRIPLWTDRYSNLLQILK